MREEEKEILAARDRRFSRIEEIFAIFSISGKTLVVLTLNLPGIEKNRYPKVFEAGVEGIGKIPFPRLFSEIDGESPAAFWVLDGEASEIKRETAALEEKHLLGRLWDFDVYTAPERTIGRKDIDLPPRLCYLCERPAKECARGRFHSFEAIEEAIRARVEQWEKNEQRAKG
ncbi:MAG TPA: citrate lyase holo-[acyl-carrier protein] synthase [Chroococcales cyanobacterium]|jgi:holo-ACP synthase